MAPRVRRISLAPLAHGLSTPGRWDDSLRPIGRHPLAHGRLKKTPRTLCEARAASTRAPSAIHMWGRRGVFSDTVHDGSRHSRHTASHARHS
jgi:hypothetical protein